MLLFYEFKNKQYLTIIDSIKIMKERKKTFQFIFKQCDDELQRYMRLFCEAPLIY